MNWIVYALFFVSGACGLIYQVAWSRLLTHVFGSTALAVSTVLAEGFRTADIFQPGTRKVGTEEMGDAVVAALQRS